MPTLRAYRRKPLTPLERSAIPPPPDPKDLPVFGPPADPETLPVWYDRRGRARDLKYERERCYALAMANRFGEYLAAVAARDRIPMDDCIVQIDGLVLYLEAFLLAAATWPQLCPMQFVDEDEDGEEISGPRTDADAVVAGLTVDYCQKRRRHRPVPTLPGCHGTPHGQECQNLRRFGEKFCPSCRRRERQKMRDAVRRP